MSDLSASTTVQRKQRARFSGDFPLAQQGFTPWSNKREQLRGLNEGQITRLVLDSDEFRDTVGKLLDEVERGRARLGKEAPFYTSLEIESVLVYQRVCGLKTYREARQRLAGDEPEATEARRLLGFDRPRNGHRRRGRKGQPVERFDGVPSESTASRHRRRMGAERHADAHDELFTRLVQTHLEFPEFRKELEILHLDGSGVFTHYQAPITDPKTRTVVNEGRVTCPDAGYLPPTAGVGKCGHGWNLTSLVTGTSLPVVYRLPKLHSPSERDTGDELVHEFGRLIVPALEAAGERELSVVSADGAFHKQAMRARCRQYGILENVHLSSHGDSKESLAGVAKRNRERIPIDGYPNWYANGHREVFCLCGRRAGKRVRLRTNGTVASRVEGKCAKCGSITITSGDWRRAQNPDRFVRCLPGEDVELRDWTLGNPLTFNSPEAGAYGRNRFGHNEGFHGTLSTRFGILNGKRWYRNRHQARLDVAIVFSVLHVVAMEQRRRVRLSDAEPPPLALAA